MSSLPPELNPQDFTNHYEENSLNIPETLNLQICNLFIEHMIKHKK
jgi:hypothetical protein